MGVTRAIRTAVWERERGRCMVTGLPLPGPDDDGWDCHHRRPKGMGGTDRADTDTVVNLIAVLPEVHNLGYRRRRVDGVLGRTIHGDPLWSRPLGLLVSKEHPPMSIPVRTWHGWVFLTPDGGYERLL